MNVPPVWVIATFAVTIVLLASLFWIKEPYQDWTLYHSFFKNRKGGGFWRNIGAWGRLLLPFSSHPYRAILQHYALTELLRNFSGRMNAILSLAENHHAMFSREQSDVYCWRTSSSMAPFSRDKKFVYFVGIEIPTRAVQEARHGRIGNRLRDEFYFAHELGHFFIFLDSIQKLVSEMFPNRTLEQLSSQERENLREEALRRRREKQGRDCSSCLLDELQADRAAFRILTEKLPKRHRVSKERLARFWQNYRPPNLALQCIGCPAGLLPTIPKTWVRECSCNLREISQLSRMLAGSPTKD